MDLSCILVDLLRMLGRSIFFRSSSTEFKTTLNWRDSNQHAILMMAVLFHVWVHKNMLSLWRLFGPLLIKYWDLLSHLKNKQQFFNISQHQWINIQNIKIDFITTVLKTWKKNLVANTPLVREINGISRSQHAYTNMPRWRQDKKRKSYSIRTRQYGAIAIGRWFTSIRFDQSKKYLWQKHATS